MFCFCLLGSTCKEIELECANFWWGMNNGKKQMHWKSWEVLCKDRSLGGLGFQRLVPFNQALLAKKAWRVLRNPQALLSRVLKARYFKHMDVMSAPLGNNPSYRDQCYG